MNMPDTRLSLEELHELDEFLADEVIEETSMDVSTLEGFMTALAIGPRTVRPSEWLPWVWDMQQGQVEAEFESEAQANRIMSLIFRHSNTVICQFLDEPASFEPVFWSGAQWGAAEWSEGFLLGLKFSEVWSLLMAGQPTWFTPFLRLGTDDGLAITKDHGDAEKWMNEIVPSLVKIHAYWKEKRNSQPGGLVENDFRIGGHKEVTQVIRQGPKVGRNDPCSCGSGKKFKKCCGIEEPSGTVH